MVYSKNMAEAPVLDRAPEDKSHAQTQVEAIMERIQRKNPVPPIPGLGQEAPRMAPADTVAADAKVRQIAEQAALRDQLLAQQAQAEEMQEEEAMLAEAQAPQGPLVFLKNKWQAFKNFIAGIFRRGKKEEAMD